MKVQAKLSRRTRSPPSPPPAFAAGGPGAGSGQDRLLGPLSGGAALYGKNVLDGMEMAADEINAKGLEVGGKKYKVEIVGAGRQVQPGRDRHQRAAPGAAAQDARRPGAALGRHLRGAGQQRAQKYMLCWPTPACRRSPSAATS
jgi:hypothetical protein